MSLYSKREQEHMNEVLKFQTNNSNKICLSFFFGSLILKYKSDISWTDMSVGSDRGRHGRKRQTQLYTQKFLPQKNPFFSKFPLGRTVKNRPTKY